MRHLLLFARRPLLGRVKTRLVPHLDATRVLALYRAFLEDQVRFVHGLAGQCRGELWWDGPAEPGAPPDSVGATLAMREQGHGDLGRRLLEAFRDSRRRGARATVVIGADSPTLPAGHVLDAFAALEAGADAVCAPAEDGGYVLLGLRRPRAELFAGVAWGGPEVLRSTLERAREAAIDLRLLEPWYDVDGPEDLRRLSRELACGARHRAPASARCLAELGIA